MAGAASSTRCWTPWRLGNGPSPGNWRRWFARLVAGRGLEDFWYGEAALALAPGRLPSSLDPWRVALEGGPDPRLGVVGA